MLEDRASTPPTSAYPADRVADIVLRGGSTVHVRPVRGDDGPRLRTFLDGVSSDSIWLRFFAMANLDWVVRWALDVDYADRFGVVVEAGLEREIIAHAAYSRIDAERAEVAFLVADAWQGRGISTILLAHLAEVAAAHDIATFTAEVLPANHRMVEVFRESGFTTEVRAEPDVVKVSFPTALTPTGQAAFDERDRRAAVAAVERVLTPHSVALVGASRRPGSVGATLLHNLVAAGFNGTTYAVNPHGGSLGGMEVHRAVAELPEPVDLAVIAVPASAVLDSARECLAAGARSLVVITSGFAETGDEGAERQRELVALCRRAGARLVGPNCLGVLNTSPDVRLNATFAPHPAPAGVIGFLSQSGALGIAIVEIAARLGVGLSTFVSVGNKGDLSGNDFLQYWESDESTRVALLYLESFGNPRKFARVARRVAQRKPIVAVKSGRSPAGVRGGASHTGALLAASDLTVDALFAQAGVIRADTLQEMFDVATLLATQPVPAGDRVGIVTNAGGPAIVCADACQAGGAQVPELSPALEGSLAAGLPAAASVSNPVDMIATASPADYRRTLLTLAESGEVDAILVIFVPALGADSDGVAGAICEVARRSPQCAFGAVFMSAEGPPAELAGEIPAFQFPEEAARAVAQAARYGRWRAAPTGAERRAEPAAVAEGASIISRALARGEEWMDPRSVWELLECHGIPVVTQRWARTPAEAARVAAEFDGAVVLKGVAPGLIHKRDVGAVVVGVRGLRGVRRAAAEMRDELARHHLVLEGYLVQPLVDDAVELLVGVTQDPSFGPVLACGAGGTNAELMRDVAARITPVSDLDATQMLRSLRMFPLLEGYRGAPACDPADVVEVIECVSSMIEAHPEIAELDCNPVLVTPAGAAVVDARIRVHLADPPAPLPAVGR
jgi:acetate---CoA ligase (ADP-forming)